jgi:hypothetical protein
LFVPPRLPKSHRREILEDEQSRRKR